MVSIDRRAAVRAYKERKQSAGLYRVHCVADGQTWVGVARDLSAIGNRLRFTLSHGTHPERRLQAAWIAHGAEAFIIETLESLPEDDDGVLRDARLDALRRRWIGRLGAAPL